jgi:glycosyltransferase involved in cell wall biosynthesis
MYDLGQAFLAEGHQVLVLTLAPEQVNSVNVTEEQGCSVIRVRAFQTKDVPYWRRTLAEFSNPFWMWLQVRKHPAIQDQQVDGVIWYSPTIFWGPLVKQLKKHFSCPSYLILRDFFPDWAVDLGVMKKGLAYYFLKAVEKYQYRQADTIGVQSPNNLTYFNAHHPAQKAKAEVLWNWIGDMPQTPCSIDLSRTVLNGKTILVYAGNMGVAQGMDVLMNLAKELKDREDVGFVFVGRGSEVGYLKEFAQENHLSNTLFFDEIPPSEIAGLYSQCHIGLLTLDPRHKTHNIPGKFLSYLKSGLAVLAVCNPGNDLEELISSYKVGFAINFQEAHLLRLQVEDLILLTQSSDSSFADQARKLTDSFFVPSQAVRQISPKFYEI